MSWVEFYLISEGNIVWPKISKDRELLMGKDEGQNNKIKDNYKVTKKGRLKHSWTLSGHREEIFDHYYTNKSFYSRLIRRTDKPIDLSLNDVCMYVSPW